MYKDNIELQFEVLSKRNMLLAMKVNQQKLEYGEHEITPAEEVTMKTKQYLEVVDQKNRREKEKIDNIKSLLLMEGRTANKVKKVDVR